MSEADRPAAKSHAKVVSTSSIAALKAWLNEAAVDVAEIENARLSLLLDRRARLEAKIALTDLELASARNAAERMVSFRKQRALYCPVCWISRDVKALVEEANVVFRPNLWRCRSCGGDFWYEDAG